MEKKAFRNLMADLERRVISEGKKNPSWLMGYLQGLGTRNLTGFQCAALVDLLLVPLEQQTVGVDEERKQENTIKKEEPEKLVASSETKKEVHTSNNLLKTLAQR